MHEQPELDADGNLWPGPEARAELARLSEAVLEERRHESPEARERRERIDESYAPIHELTTRLLQSGAGPCGDPDCLIETGEGDHVCAVCQASARDTELIFAAVNAWPVDPEREVSEAELQAAHRRGMGGEFSQLREETTRHQFTIAHESQHVVMGPPPKITSTTTARRRTGARARSKGCAGTRTKGSRRSVSRSSSRGGDSGGSDSSEGDGEPAAARPLLHLVPNPPPRRHFPLTFACLSAEERGADVEPVVEP